MPTDHSFTAGGAELLGRVEPLWLQLRRHHASLAPQWAAELLAKSFDERRDALIVKAGAGLLVLLATVPGRDLGYCVSTVTAGGQGEVDSLFVVPAHRGLGIGHALMSRTMEWFGEQSARPIVVDLMGGNEAAQRFYVRHGFHPRTVRLMRVSGSVA